MKRGLILLSVAMLVTTTSVIMYEPQADMRTAYESSAKPVEVPYLDLTINQVREQQNGRTDKDVNDAGDQDLGETEQPSGADAVISDDGTGAAEDSGAVEEGEDSGSVSELVEPESDESVGGSEDPILTYYGNCRITFYDVGPCCCGEFANGYTASGEEAVVGWTCANGALDFGTLVMIDGHIYCVTDRGVDGDQFDILVGSHEEALQRGLYYADVYIVN